MIARLLRRMALKRQIDRDLRALKAARKIRSEAAQRGVSTQWRNRGEQCRKTFGLPG